MTQTVTRTVTLLLLLAMVPARRVLAAQSLTKTGTTAAPFLKIGIGPRAIGMGGASTATADDITAIYWNPGGLANVCSNRRSSITSSGWRTST